MINWKKENYCVGDTVCIVNKMGFHNTTERYIDGKVTYVGTKKLKVSIRIRDKESVIEFNGKRSTKGVFYTDYYFVYKTKAEYDRVVMEEKRVEQLRKYIVGNINRLSLDDLEAVKNMID